MPDAFRRAVLNAGFAVLMVLLLSLDIGLRKCELTVPRGFNKIPAVKVRLARRPTVLQRHPPRRPRQAWHVAFSEEFNGNDYDHKKLTPCFDWNYGACTDSFNLGKETYKPEQVRVSDGTAKLVAEPLLLPSRTMHVTRVFAHTNSAYSLLRGQKPTMVVNICFRSPTDTWKRA